MFYLVYTSYAADTFKTEEDLRSLLLQSRVNNDELAITGMLYYFNHSFIQLLEGKEHDVREIYKKIRVDVRHKHIVTLKVGNNETRFFPDWSMGYKSLKIGDEEIENNSTAFAEGIIHVPSVLKLFEIAADKN
jgi:hypothetical protein